MITPINYPKIELVALNASGKQPNYLKSLIEAIWPKRTEEIYNLFVNGAAEIDASHDHPYVIILNDKPIGLTGFYYFNETSVGLCWHGVIPSFRGQGISQKAFREVCQLAQISYPNATVIVELIPSDRIETLAPYFYKLGFVNSNKCASFDYLPKEVLWHIYEAPL